MKQHLVLPIWFLISPDASGLCAVVRWSTHELVVPIFTDGDLARSFRDSHRLGGCNFACVPEAQHVPHFIETARRAGATHVVIDPGGFEEELVTLEEIAGADSSGKVIA